MRGSFQLFSYKNIPVRIHWSFLLIFAVIGLEIHRQGLLLNEALWLVFLFFWVFTFVVLHEFGHALTARRYGINTYDIVLLPIGGLARLMRSPTRPWEEFVIALAGPMVNLVLAFLMGFWLVITRPWPWITLEAYHLQASTFIPTLVILNLSLFFFNLIPALPMDGGRVLRSILAFFMPRRKATLVAVILGKIIATGLIFFGWHYQEWTILMIGAFVFYQSGREYRQVVQEERWRQTPLSTLLSTNPLYRHGIENIEDHNELVHMDASATVYQAWERLRDHPSALILVFQHHIPIGILSYDQLMKKP